MRFLVVLVCFSLVGASCAAELSKDEQQIARSVGQAIQQAGERYAAGDFAIAGDRIRDAIEQIENAFKEGSPDLRAELEPDWRRVSKAHLMLEFEGVSLPPLPEQLSNAESPPAPKRRPRRRRTTARGNPPAIPPPMTGIGFNEVVAPILVNRCGRCHIADSKGGFSMATFSALMKGPPEGVVIFAGDLVASRLIETIETGDMPRGGGRVTAQELQTLKSWIMSGAKFDGPDPNAPLAVAGVPPSSGNASASTPLQARRPTGKETVSFASDVAPILVEHCRGCHIDAARTRGGLRMDTFAQLLRGGDSGVVISPGKGEESLLVKKLRGSVGQQMPAGGRPALPDLAIELIATWIDEGATLDGSSDNQPLSVMSQLAWASAANSTQMSQRRQELAAKNMKLLTASGGAVFSRTTDHFLVIGSASEETIDLVAKLAEDSMPTVKKVVSAKPREDFFHGRATLFVLPKRYDYSEFAKMIEARDVPSDWTSHWEFDGIDAYVSLVASEQDEEDAIAARLMAPLVSLALATRGGDVPRWLAEGVGVATANRNASSRDREVIKQAEAEIAEAMAALTNAKQFLDGKMAPAQTDRIGAAIATALLDRTRRRNFNAMLRNLDAGKPFELAFEDAFRGTPQQFVEVWIRWARGG